MKGCSEAQALIRGERGFPCVAGCVRVSPLRCGSMVQIHIHGLPCSVSRFGFSIEQCGRRILTASLTNAGGEALLSVYTDAFLPCEIIGANAVVTSDPCAPCACMVACGCFQHLVRPGCCPPDPRPLFAAPIRR